MTAHRSFAARADIEAILVDLGALRIDLPILQPIDAFLDTAGEELRRRIFVTQSETGEALCLRPEFTIPVCRAHLSAGDDPARHGYVGTVFRQRRAGSNEFLQAGIEDIGDADIAAADARAMADAHAMLGRLGRADCATWLGDQTVFDAVLAALGLPAGWRLRLAQAFGSDAALGAALDRLAAPAPMPDLPDAIAAPALAGDVGALTGAIEADLRAASLSGAGGRTAAEIAERLMGKIAAARRAPDPAQVTMLREFLAIRTPLAGAIETLEAFAQTHRIDMAEALAAFAARASAIEAAGLDMSSITYQASFGRRLDYYTGVVFELRAADGAVLAGGGRYDRLLELLGAPRPMPGIGFSVWLDRVAEPGGSVA